MANNGRRCVDLEALLGRVQGMPIYSTPVEINQEPGLGGIVRNLEQKIARIMTTELDKFEERVQKMPTYFTPGKINQEPGLDNIVRNLEQQMAQIRIAAHQFSERVQGMPIYCTPVKTNPEPSLTDMIRNVEQQMERIMTAQLDKLEEIVGVVNSLTAGYEQMGTKFEKLHADVTVLRARLDDANSADNETEVLHPEEKNASHDETHHAQGGVMRTSDNTCDEIQTEMGAGHCRVAKAQNSNCISHGSKIYPLYNERNEEPENLPSTHGDLNKISGGMGLDRSINRRCRTVFAFEEQ